MSKILVFLMLVAELIMVCTLKFMNVDFGNRLHLTVSLALFSVPVNVLLSCFLFRNSENKINKIAISVFVLFYLTALIGVIFYKFG